jgi:DNA-directed RNA polymerase specialized sigma24 family protein
MEDRPPYETGHADTPEPPPLTTEDLEALAHARRQGILYETGERLLEQLPERLRALADLVLSGKMSAEEIAYALAVLTDSIEHAPADARPRRH